MSELSTDKIIREYFKQKDILVKHQLESYNDYIDNIIPNILSQFFPISIDINNENINVHKIEICYENYSIGNPYYYKPYEGVYETVDTSNSIYFYPSTDPKIEGFYGRQVKDLPEIKPEIVRTWEFGY